MIWTVIHPPDGMEGQAAHALLHAAPDGDHHLEPGGERGKVPGNEGGEGVAVVGPVELSVTEAVNEDDGVGGGHPATLLQEGEGGEDTLGESGVGVCEALGEGEDGSQGVVRGEELVVGGEGRSLSQLCRQGVDPLPHQAAEAVVHLAEVEGHDLRGQTPQVAGWAPGLREPSLPHPGSSLTEAAVLHQLEDEGSLATARSTADDHPPVCGQGAGEVAVGLLVQPVPANEQRLWLTLGNLEKEWLEEPLDGAELMQRCMRKTRKFWGCPSRATGRGAS